MRIDLKLKQISLALLKTVCLLTLFITGCTEISDQQSKSYKLKSDLSDHKIYKTYNFLKSDRLINIGTQPMYMPTGLITEMMKRDRILKSNLSDLGFRVQFFSFFKGNDINFFLKSGELAGGIGGDMPMLRAAVNQDIFAPILMQLGELSIVAQNHISVADLKGKRIGYPYGSNAHYTLLNALEKSGINEFLIKHAPMEIDELPAALKNGDIDAFAAWEPAPSIALNDSKNAAVIYSGTSSGYMYFSRAFYENNQDAVQHILAAVLRAVEWMQADVKNSYIAASWLLKEVADFTGEELQIPIQDLVKLAANDIIGRSSLPLIPEEYLQMSGPLHREFIFLKERHKIPPASEWQRVRDSLDYNLLKAIDANPEKYLQHQFNYLLK
ncbi:MAG: NrtA/SsuA/CpmA family ABC transporter substrate-binding protein [Nitrospira sp.]|nr:NrtA/SsuA/CpmA family ABC transporter substrate-binding protein [Nitrospira sp.]